MSSRVLIVGGGSELQPQLRRLAEDVETVVLCRASSLPYVHEPHENRAVVMLNDSCSPGRWIRAARAIHAEPPSRTAWSRAVTQAGGSCGSVESVKRALRTWGDTVLKPSFGWEG